MCDGANWTPTEEKKSEDFTCQSIYTTLVQYISKGLWSVWSLSRSLTTYPPIYLLGSWKLTNSFSLSFYGLNDNWRFDICCNTTTTSSVKWNWPYRNLLSKSSCVTSNTAIPHWACDQHWTRMWLITKEDNIEIFHMMDMRFDVKLLGHLLYFFVLLYNPPSINVTLINVNSLYLLTKLYSPHIAN